MVGHQTALSRRKVSAPFNYLIVNGLLKGKVLDYGCGKGMDADTIGCDRYDPYYAPIVPKGKYSTITCTYVLNVVNPVEVNGIINNIKSLLTKGGIAYISVRRDIPKEGLAGRGCYQYYVTLPYPILKENNQYCTYILTK